jgi:hypothetical protein
MAEERPQTIEEWRAMLAGTADAGPAKPQAASARPDVRSGPPSASTPPAPAWPRWRSLVAYALGAAVIGAAAIGLYELVRSWSG